MMFSQVRAGQLNAGGDGTQETSTASTGVTGEQFIQWQQRVTATRHGKEEKLRQDTLVVESGGRRITQLKTDNEQLDGKKEQLAAESKMEEVLLNDTEAHLGFLEELLQEVGGLGGMVKQMQEQEELTKVEQDSRLRDMEERLCQVQLTEKEEKIKLDEGIRSVMAGVEAKFVEHKEVLEATEKQHSALVEAEVVQSQERRDLEAKVDAVAKVNVEHEEGARVKAKAVLEGKSYVETTVVEVDKNKVLLQALMIQAAADKDAGRRKVSDVEEEKKLRKERLSQDQECVDQLRQAASSRQIETAALLQQVSDLVTRKTNQEQRRKQLQGDIEQLNKLSKQMEVALERKDAAKKQLDFFKAILQEKFDEEKTKVVLQGQAQVAGEQVELKKEELKVLESQVDSEEANLQRLKTESNTSMERKLDCRVQNEKLQTMVTRNREENMVMCDTTVKMTEEKLKVLKIENRNLIELVETLDREVTDTLTENKKLDQEFASVKAEEAGEEQMIASAKSEREDLAKTVKKVEEETERLKCTIHPREEALLTKKERSHCLVMKLNQVSEERRSTEENLAANSGNLNKVELYIQQLDSKAEKLNIDGAEVGDRLAEASSLLEQGERKQERKGEHAENMKKVKKLQKTAKQVKSEMTVVIKRKEKLERQCGKTRMEKSKVKEEIDQVEGDIKSIRGNIEGLLAAAADEDKVLLSGKGEFERSKAEAEGETNQSQVLRSQSKGLKDKIKQAEGLLRKEKSKIEEQNMMLEEKQRKGDAILNATEAECHDLEQSLCTANEYLEQSQSQKKQLIEKVDKVKKELDEVEKAISTAPNKTPQQLRKSGSDRNRFSTPLPILKKKEADLGKQENSTLFRTPSSDVRRTPEQVRRASPSVGMTRRGNRTLLQPTMSPMVQNKGHPSLISQLKATNATAPESPFEVASYTDSD